MLGKRNISTVEERALVNVVAGPGPVGETFLPCTRYLPSKQSNDVGRPFHVCSTSY